LTLLLLALALLVAIGWMLVLAVDVAGCWLLDLLVLVAWLIAVAIDC
jgi:hypothetical protein